MPRVILLSFALIVFCAPLTAQQKDKPKWAPSPHVAATEPLRPEEQLQKMKVPPGFEIQLVAADPDIRKPINIAFDAAGRLWVTETIEYPYPAKPGQGRDAVKILEDFGPDGRALKSGTFAADRAIPIGVMPDTDGKGALIYDIPNIRRFRDTDGDGKADKNEVYYSSFGFKDTHGMTGEFVRGFDGWIYACHGFANTSNVKSKDGSTSISMTSGNTYRIKPDGSRIEKYTTGQVNPFGIAIDPYGNLFTADCHSRPLTMLLRGGWYESFARPHDGLGFAPHLNTFNGHSTALCGITYYAANQFPKQYEGKLFLGDVVLNRVNAYRLETKANGPTAIMEDFIKSQDPWFRPVDIKLGPDGCLYIADFYNRIIGHYEVPLDHPGRDRDKGRIWRVVWRGGSKKEAPQPIVDLLKADVPTLVKTLSHPNLMVRLHAADQLVERGGDEAVKQLVALIERTIHSGDARHQAHAYWILERLGKLDDKDLGKAVSTPNKDLRVHAMRILAEKKTWSPQYTAWLKGEMRFPNDALVQRLAIEALAAQPRPEHIEPLLGIGHNYFDAGDPHGKYAYRYALREQFRNKEAWDNYDPKKHGGEYYVAEICKAIPSEHSATFLRGFIERTKNKSHELIRHAVRHGSDSATEWAIRHADQQFQFLPSYEPPDLPQHAVILKAIVQANQERGRKLSEEERTVMAAAVQRMLDTKLSRPNNSEMFTTVAELAGLLRMEKTLPTLIRMAQASRFNTQLGKACVTAAVAIDPKEATKRLEEVLMERPFLSSPEARGTITSTLASLDAPEAHELLIRILENAPASVQTTIALGMSGSSLGGDRLLKAIEAGKASPRLLQDRTIEVKLLSAKIPDVKQRLKKLTEGLPPVEARTQELIAAKSKAFSTFKTDIDQGRGVFNTKCAACHQISSQGGKVGPQLDGIGVRGLERLLEDILDPNRNIDQAFRTTQIITKKGQNLTGLFLREEGNVVILGDKDGKEVRVEKGMIDERHILPLSPMPSNFAETLSEPEFHHLMAFLLSQRGKK